MEQLAEKKSKLFHALGEHRLEYLALLKSWFKCSLSKVDFDHEARKLLNKDNIVHHNAFLVALFTKCQQLVDQQDPPIERKRSKVKVKTAGKQVKLLNEQRYLFNDVRESSPIKRQSVQISDKHVQFCTSEKALPDYFMNHLRLFVNVWEYDIDGISDGAIHLTNLAIRELLKNVITSVLLFKDRYTNQIRPASHLNCFLANASELVQYPSEESILQLGENENCLAESNISKEVTMHDALLKVACERWEPQKSSIKRIHLGHLYHALRLYRNTLPTHAVFAANIERIQMRLTTEELI